ncbi:hypothetical protein QBZ16_001125 [Prototheca wickerhamii]|uniref:RRM domain-containing protein n=1 Tax=Prototheca wickerhamii TaxID=3111 RepID=A0AAD9IDX2_PROWI|nr:hypothetical protein QBZ16_001125 [Prototheca wickerhamii]
MDVLPNQTIYISNVFEKLKKEETKRLIYALFGRFGRILDIVVMRGERLRGQAWVVYTDVGAATEALRAMQDFPFYGKPLRLSFAKGKSEAVARLEFGTKKSKKDRKAAKDAAEGAAANGAAGNAARAAPAAPAPPRAAEDAGEPNETLFVQNLPEATTSEMLSMLFSQYTGFVEVRMVHAKPGIAFVDFQNESQSAVALSGLNGFRVVPDRPMQVTFAKR